MIPTRSHYTALITGANSGIGLELTQKLLSEEWEVIALIRSDFPDGNPLISTAKQNGRLRVYHADLSDSTSLRQALADITSHEQHIDVLFNNAADPTMGIRYSPQGREIHFEVNTVVPYIITMEMQPLLLKGALKTVINTSSNAMLYVKDFDLDLLTHPTSYRAVIGPYGKSKLGLSLWTHALAPTLANKGIEIRSMNPGANKTKMTGRAKAPLWMRLLRPLIFSHPSVGAGRLYDVALGRWRGQSGIFVNGGKAVAIPFIALEQDVLAMVHTIYAQEFLGTQRGRSIELSLPLLHKSGGDNDAQL
jgi:NAD(P)-dependent dehydrogenase (short-subunit alcohol dehydrogenase family)